MSTKKITVTQEGTFIKCPHCLVYSIKLSAEEHTSVEAGQQMIEVCQVCGNEVVINGS